MELPDPPDGWHIKSINEINDHSWSASLWSAENYVYGYGSSLRYAMLDAIRRVEIGDVYSKCSGYSKQTEDKKTREGVEKLLKEIKAKSAVANRDRRF